MAAERKSNGRIKANSMREFPTGPPKIAHPMAWLWEPLEEDPTFMLRKMFGGTAIYLHGKLMIYFSRSTDEPWRGMLVCTERGHHASLMSDFPELEPHKHLGKWLFLPESNDQFERTAEKLVRLVLYRDPRIGIIPPAKKNRKGKTKRAKPVV
jgi:hypothetical protein